MFRIFACSILLVTIFLALSCKESENAASSGSRLFLTADPQQISFNGTSSLTVSGSDENGTPLPDGTQVSFSVTEAGSVSPRTVSLVNGTARSTYHATFVAGDITITAISGSIEANTTVTVTDSKDQNVFVSANPANLPNGGGSSLISAVVTDASGQPVANVRVQFSTTEGTLQSGGGSVETNSSGLAIDTLNTTLTATVTATTDDGVSGDTEVVVGVGRIVCHMTVSDNTPSVGQTVMFFDTSDVPAGQTVTFHWDFGDSASATGENAQHAYNAAGAFDVIHSVTDAQGNTTSCEPFTIQVSN
jgi:hypothetical protein